MLEQELFRSHSVQLLRLKQQQSKLLSCALQQ